MIEASPWKKKRGISQGPFPPHLIPSPICPTNHHTSPLAQDSTTLSQIHAPRTQPKSTKTATQEKKNYLSFRPCDFPHTSLHRQNHNSPASSSTLPQSPTPRSNVPPFQQ